MWLLLLACGDPAPTLALPEWKERYRTYYAPCQPLRSCESRCLADTRSCADAIRGFRAEEQPVPIRVLQAVKSRCDEGDPDACMVFAIEQDNLASLRQLCEAGKVEACDVVARRMPDQAERWLKIACDARDGEGCRALARYYFETRNHVERREILGRLCFDEDGPACRELAGLYEVGLGLPTPDAERALLALNRACEAGHLSSCHEAAARIAVGRGTEPDPERAMEMVSDACALGPDPRCP